MRSTSDSGDFGHNPNAPLPPIAWFESLLETRQRNAAFGSAAVGVLLFVPLVIFVQSSAYHPIQSLSNVLYLLLSPQFWISAAAVGAFGFALAKFYVRNCFHPFYETNFNVKKFQVVAAATAMWATCGVFWAAATYASVRPVYMSWALFTFFAAVSFFTAWQTALGANFRWQCTKIGLFAHLTHVTPFVVRECGIDLPRNLIRGLIPTIPIALLHSTVRPSFLDLLLAPSTIASMLLVVFAVQAITRLTFEIINVTTMQPIALPLITGFGGTPKQQRQQQSMIAAITSDDDLLRLFGLRALHDAASTSLNTRAPIYALSQPGHKPRNWEIVYDVCTRVIDIVREQLQVTTNLVETELGERKTTLVARPEAHSPAGGPALIGARHRNVAQLGLNLRPANTPTIRPMARRRFDLTEHSPTSLALSNGSTGANGSGEQTTQVNSQHSPSLPNYHPNHYLLSKSSKMRLLRPPRLIPRPPPAAAYASKPWINVRAFPGYQHVQKAVDQLRSTFLKPAPNVSSYCLTLTEYSLQTLSALAVHSIDEDKYGVVQENIGEIFGQFLRLELAIDLYIRSTSNNKAEQAFRPNLHQMEDVLINSLLSIHATFRDYVEALQLSDAERKMLKVLANVEGSPQMSA
ncbi:hypothetical protein M3Y99_00904300 [Aphelenchoides fujianensis]|nr:hypothetical protein M3Y99_00904300 [Aphelenchoides fujianensis]